MANARVPTPLLTEAELLRRLNFSQHRAEKLREAGALVPDFSALNGRMRLYCPERVKKLAATGRKAALSTAAPP